MAATLATIGTKNRFNPEQPELVAMDFDDMGDGTYRLWANDGNDVIYFDRAMLQQLSDAIEKALS